MQNMSLCGNTTAVHADIDLQGEANRLLVASSLCLLLPSMVVALLLGSCRQMIKNIEYSEFRKIKNIQ